MKIMWVIFSTITFSGLVAFSGSILRSVFDKDAVVPEYVIDGIIWFACSILISFLVVLGLSFSEYFEYKNMKQFLEDLQDILDYNLYEEKENEDNTSQVENIKENENVETKNKTNTKKCKKKIGRKITIEIVKYDYTGDSIFES